MQQEITRLKRELKTKNQLLDKYSSTVEHVKSQKRSAIRKLYKQYDLVVADLMKLEEAFEEISTDATVSDEPLETTGDDIESSSESFCFETKKGKKYSPAIRKLYYYLLSTEIPPAKIANIVREVLSSFFPNVDVSSLKLPGESCAGYMHREELKTISSAHQATVLAVEAENGGFHVNSDNFNTN